MTFRSQPIYLTGVCSPAINAAANLGDSYEAEHQIGMMLQPQTFSKYLRFQSIYKWAAIDNGCFTEQGRKEFDWTEYLQWITAYNDVFGDHFLFATVPDVPCDWATTLAQFGEGCTRIRETGVAVAIVLQDGATIATVPWHSFDVVFVGGSTEWKLGREARNLVEHAKRIGKWVHVGRVNSYRRLVHCADIGADSADGTYLRFRGSTGAIEVIDWLRKNNQELAAERRFAGLPEAYDGESPGQIE